VPKHLKGGKSISDAASFMDERLASKKKMNPYIHMSVCQNTWKLINSCNYSTYFMLIRFKIYCGKIENNSDRTTITAQIPGTFFAV